MSPNRSLTFRDGTRILPVFRHTRPHAFQASPTPRVTSCVRCGRSRRAHG